MLRCAHAFNGNLAQIQSQRVPSITVPFARMGRFLEGKTRPVWRLRKSQHDSACNRGEYCKPRGKVYRILPQLAQNERFRGAGLWCVFHGKLRTVERGEGATYWPADVYGVSGKRYTSGNRWN